MKCSRLVALAAVCLLAYPAAQVSAQSVANPSFEDPVVSGGSAVGAWFVFNGGGGAGAGNSTAGPRTGAQNLLLDLPGLNNNFAGAFQDILGVSPGQTATFSVWNKYAGPIFDIGAEVRIEWRNPANTAEVSRTANFVPTLTSDYTQFSINGVVPAGVGVARVVYAIQSFGPDGTNTGTAYVDDASFSVVPEPTTAALVGCVAVGLGAARRRRS